MKEFVINKFLSLRLEEDKTNIYVNGKRFDQCKYLMLNVPIKKTKKFDEFESIDEAADVLRWTVDGQKGIQSHGDKYTFNGELKQVLYVPFY